MCGIAGLVRESGLAPGDLWAVQRMTTAQAHRGPASEGIHHDGQAVLGHRRLSIIDVSEAGNQPMSNEDGTLWLTYNGEIYNYRELRGELVDAGHTFRSWCDTEVIVHGYEQWGIGGLLSRLRGMFAFALRDREGRTVLARDRLGIKPLYFAHRPELGLLLFASEVHAILSSNLVSQAPDMDAVAAFLLFGSVPAPMTVNEGIRSLLPGHYAVLHRQRFTTTRYWDIGEIGGDSQEPAFRDLVQDAVARHMVSDVPLGVFLSGGVDSGALVTCASRARPGGRPLKTLTIAFDEPDVNEAEQARAVARRFATDHLEVRVTEQDFERELPRILAAMDQPTNDGVNTWFVSKAARDAGLTVVLSGLGGDEVFWGYRHYRWLAGRARWLARCPAVARRPLARAAAAWGQFRGRERWMRMSFLHARASSPELYLLMRGFFPPQQVQRLLDLDGRTMARVVERQVQALRPAAAAPPRTPLTAAFNRIEFRRYLHDQLLRDTDVFSMAHSIEVRVPLLDHVIVEHAARVRPSQKLARRTNKPLLVDAVNEPLLAAAGRARKQGFSFPFDRWMRNAARDLEERAAAGTLLNRATVHQLWSEFRGRRLHWSRAWALTVLGSTVH